MPPKRWIPSTPEAKAKYLAYHRAYRREWAKKNPEKRAAQIARSAPKTYARTVGDPVLLERQRVACRESNKKVRLRLIALLGGKCVECGHSDPRSLHIDHVRGNGAEERRMRGRSYYLRMIDNVASGDYALLCACHNDIKSRVMGEAVGCSKGPPPCELAVLTDPKKIARRAANMRHKERVAANPELLEKRKERRRRAWAVLRQQVIDALGGVCVQCGWSDPRALHVDHVHGGGTKHRKSMAHKDLYKHYIESAGSGDYALLCSNHNQQKKIDLAETALGHRWDSVRRKHEHATESPPPKATSRSRPWTPERHAQMAAKRAAQAEADAALALVLAAKREAAKNPPAESSET